MEYFRASYEDFALAEAAARKEGYTDGASLCDFIEPFDYRAGKSFPTLAQAEEWLKSKINGNKTVFGCGTIYLRESVDKRCRYCVCGGVRNLHEYTVDDTGIVEDNAIEDMCL